MRVIIMLMIDISILEQAWGGSPQFQTPLVKVGVRQVKPTGLVPLAEKCVCLLLYLLFLSILTTLLSSTTQPRKQPLSTPPHPRRTNPLLTTPHSPKAISRHQRNTGTRICPSRWKTSSSRNSRPCQDRREQDKSNMGFPRTGGVHESWTCRPFGCYQPRSVSIPLDIAIIENTAHRNMIRNRVSATPSLSASPSKESTLRSPAPPFANTPVLATPAFNFTPTSSFSSAQPSTSASRS